MHVSKLLAASLMVGALSAPALADMYDAPAGYYSSATGTGSTLENQLYNIMRTGQIQRSYGDFRYSARITDADPNRPGYILLAYNRASVSANWDSGSTWNREHVWPQSLQPGDASNSTRGNLGDPHSLRPINPSINSSRGNKPFGSASSTGSYGAVSGGYYFPGDQDKGDIARQLFYSDTRYGPEKGISLKNGSASGNSMGDLNALIAWNYSDTPDEFERHRNEAIYSSSLNPSYYTNNRNAYIDHPEYVWSVFVDQNNDSKLTLGGATASADGSSHLDLDFGRVIMGAPVSSMSQTVYLNKTGNAGTYYSVSSDSAAVATSVSGRFNAFEVGGSGSQAINIGLQSNSNTPGKVGGTVTIDNLDVTTGLGSGYGAGDGNDTIDASMTVLGHSNGSFAADSDIDWQVLDFGSITVGDSSPVLNLDIFNLDLAYGQYTAGLDLDNFALVGGDASAFTNDMAAFSNLGAGQGETFQFTMDTSVKGVFSATYMLYTSDEDIAGASAGTAMAFEVRGTVIAVPEPMSIALFGVAGVVLVSRRKHVA